MAFQIPDEGTEEETRRFFVYLRGMGLCVKGVAMDGSPLYPKVIAKNFFNPDTQKVAYYCW